MSGSTDSLIVYFLRNFERVILLGSDICGPRVSPIFRRGYVSVTFCGIQIGTPVIFSRRPLGPVFYNPEFLTYDGYVKIDSHCKDDTTSIFRCT